MWPQNKQPCIIWRVKETKLWTTIIDLEWNGNGKPIIMQIRLIKWLFI